MPLRFYYWEFSSRLPRPCYKVLWLQNYRHRRRSRPILNSRNLVLAAVILTSEALLSDKAATINWGTCERSGHLSLSATSMRRTGTPAADSSCALPMRTRTVRYWICFAGKRHSTCQVYRRLFGALFRNCEGNISTTALWCSPILSSSSGNHHEFPPTSLVDSRCRISRAW